MMMDDDWGYPYDSANHHIPKYLELEYQPFRHHLDHLCVAALMFLLARHILTPVGACDPVGLDLAMTCMGVPDYVWVTATREIYFGRSNPISILWARWEKQEALRTIMCLGFFVQPCPIVTQINLLNYLHSW